MTKIKQLRLAVIDDHELVRNGICNYLLKGWPHGKVVLEAENGLDYERACAGIAPIDIALVDLSMPLRDGYQTLEWMQENQPTTMGVAISHEPTDEQAYCALQAKARTVLSKNIRRADMWAALDAVRLTGRYVNPLVQRQLTYRPDPGTPLALRKKLKDEVGKYRLRWMLAYTAEHEPSIQAASKAVGVTANTGEGYRKEIRDITGAGTRAAMLRLLMRFGGLG